MAFRNRIFWAVGSAGAALAATFFILKRHGSSPPSNGSDAPILAPKSTDVAHASTAKPAAGSPQGGNEAAPKEAFGPPRPIGDQLAEKLRLALADKSPTRRHAIEDLGAALAHHDPEQAMILTKKMLEGGTRAADVYAFVSGFSSEYATIDPAKAATWSEFLPLELKFGAATFVAQNWSKVDLEAATRWADSLTEPSLRLNVLRRMAETLEQSTDHERGAAWARQIAAAPDAAQNAPMIARLWARTDASGALDWLARLEDTPARTSAMVAVASSITDQDPVTASGWVEQFPAGDLKNQTVAAISDRWAERDPEAAAHWVSRVAEQHVFETSMHSIARRWLERDRPRAQEWIANSALPETTKKYLLPRD